MKKNSVTIIILLAAAGLGYYLWTKRRKTATSIAEQAGSVISTAAGAAGQVIDQGGAGQSTQGAGTISATSGKITFTDAELDSLLSKGKTGNTVKALQSYLKKAGRNIGAAGIDGIFGTDTESALQDQEGVKTTTLNTLSITAYDINSKIVYGDKSGWLGEGIWNGEEFL